LIYKLKVTVHNHWNTNLKWQCRTTDIQTYKFKFKFFYWHPICKTRQVEDENHFILKCKRFEQIRLKFYDKVSKTLNFKIFNNVENKMKILLNNKSYLILKLTSSFIGPNAKKKKKIFYWNKLINRIWL
jgi:hypothetical protein